MIAVVHPWLSSSLYYFRFLTSSFCCTLGKRGRIWEGGKGCSDFIIVLDHSATLLCKHNRFDSLLFPLLGKVYYHKINGSPDWILITDQCIRMFLKKTRNGIDIHEGEGAYAGLNIEWVTL